MGMTIKPNFVVLAGLLFIRTVQVALISQFRDQSRKLIEINGNIWIGLLFMYLVVTIFAMMYKHQIDSFTFSQLTIDLLLFITQHITYTIYHQAYAYNNKLLEGSDDELENELSEVDGIG